MTQVSGDMTSGGMTLERLDCKPLHLVLYILVCNCISVFIKILEKFKVKKYIDIHKLIVLNFHVTHLEYFFTSYMGKFFYF